MKKLILFFTLSALASCSSIAYGQVINSINTFTQIEVVNGTLQTTSPISLQYAIKQDLSQSAWNPFAFEAIGFGHAFNGSNIIINDLPIVAGIAAHPFSNQTIAIGIGAGVNILPETRFIVGINFDIQLVQLNNLGASLKGASPKKKHNLSIGL